MTSSQRIKKIIKLSNTTTCNYKYTEGDIWLTIPRETERFTTSDEFRKFDLKIFNHLLETNTTPTIPENEADIEYEYSDFDDTDADPDYQPKDLLPNGDENVENNIGIADHPTDNNETESRNDVFELMFKFYIILLFIYPTSSINVFICILFKL